MTLVSEELGVASLCAEPEFRHLVSFAECFIIVTSRDVFARVSSALLLSSVLGHSQRTAPPLDETLSLGTQQHFML